MKLPLIILLSAISFNSLSQNKNYIDNSNRKTLSYIMIGSGVSLSVASATTPLEWSRDSNGLSYTKPLHENPAHFAGLLSGIGVSFGGVLTLIANKDNSKRKR
jgi:hypothetical protein